MGACWTVATQSICLTIFYHSISMPADLLPLIPACLLVLCISICHTCLYDVSRSAVPAGVLTIGHAFWCDASLSAMPSGVLSHHRPRLLVWYLIINRAHWCGASLQAISSGQLPLQLTFLLVEWRWKDGYKSGATCTEVSSHQTCLLNCAQNYNASLKLRTT